MTQKVTAHESIREADLAECNACDSKEKWLAEIRAMTPLEALKNFSGGGIVSQDVLDVWEMKHTVHGEKEENARANAMAEAKKLRAEGWTAKVKTVSFSGFGYGDAVFMDAVRRKVK